MAPKAGRGKGRGGGGGKSDKRKKEEKGISYHHACSVDSKPPLFIAYIHARIRCSVANPWQLKQTKLACSSSSEHSVQLRDSSFISLHVKQRLKEKDC